MNTVRYVSIPHTEIHHVFLPLSLSLSPPALWYAKFSVEIFMENFYAIRHKVFR